jgi:hypothetical protein
MSGIKRWIFAILIVVAFAGYLTLSGIGAGDKGCLSAFLYPDITPPARLFAGKIGMAPNHIGGARWGTEKGKPILFLYDTNGRGIATEVCMMDDPMNPTVVLVETQ